MRATPGQLLHVFFTFQPHVFAQLSAGMADRVGLRMEYLGPDSNWFALVDGDDMEDAVEFARVSTAKTRGRAAFDDAASLTDCLRLQHPGPLELEYEHTHLPDPI